MFIPKNFVGMEILCGIKPKKNLLLSATLTIYVQIGVQFIRWPIVSQEL